MVSAETTGFTYRRVVQGMADRFAKLAAKNKHWILVAFLALTVTAMALFFSSNTLSFIQGDSMFPTFSPCTLAVVNLSQRPDRLLPGEIAVIDISEQGAEFSDIAHRVVENLPEQQKLSTRGDNGSYYEFPSSIDGYFPYDKVAGKVTQYITLPEIVCKLKGG